MKVLVAGGAGFIGSHVVDMLLEKGNEVIVLDNSPEGNNLHHLNGNKNLTVINADLNNLSELKKTMNGVDEVYHLAANSDIQSGGKNPEIDFKNTFMTTKNILDAMVANDVKKIFFSSTSAVYGNITGIALKEDTGGLSPISYYGAAKLSSEALISSYSYMNDIGALIFRFPNVVGPRVTHGVIFDFMRKLKDNPKKLEILGDGKQNKEYIYVHDLIKAISSVSIPTSGVETYNVSTESSISVMQIADIVCEKLGLKNVKYSFTGGNIGWKGDVPSFKYDISKIKKTGWMYQHSSTDAIKMTLRNLLDG